MLPDSDPHSKAFWSPDAGFTQLVQGTWKGKPVERTVMTFSNPPVQITLLYDLWGSNLPTTRDDYARRLNIDLSLVPDIAKVVDDLIKAYQQVQTNSKAFRDQSWTSLVDLAGGIYNFTKVAGGEASSSYYAGLMQALNDYNAAKKKADTAKMKEAAETILEFSDDLVARATNLTAEGRKLIGDVTKFSDSTYSAWASLNSTLEDIKRRLDPLEVKNLGIIKGLQKTSSDQRVEYTFDVVARGTLGSYAICPLFGVLPATPASEYGPRISAIKNVVQAIENEIKTDDKKVQASRTIATDAQQVTGDTYAVLEQIQGMIAATKAIQVGWERITTDLKYLNEAAKGDKIPDVEFDKVFIQQSIEGWNQFGVYVDSFRKSAYLFEPEAMTIDKWAEKIGQ